MDANYEYLATVDRMRIYARKGYAVRAILRLPAFRENLSGAARISPILPDHFLA